MQNSTSLSGDLLKLDISLCFFVCSSLDILKVRVHPNYPPRSSQGVISENLVVRVYSLEIHIDLYLQLELLSAQQKITYTENIVGKHYIFC